MRPRPRTWKCVLKDPRGQGHVLEDSITGMLYNIDECRQGQLEQPYRMIVVTGDTVFAFTADRTTTATAKKTVSSDMPRTDINRRVFFT